MANVIKSAGYGILAASVLLIVVYFFGVYLKGPQALRDALDPLAVKTYLALAPLLPGVFLLWLSDHIAARRRRDTAGSRTSH
jgi:hypothetical protein